MDRGARNHLRWWQPKDESLKMFAAIDVARSAGAGWLQSGLNSGLNSEFPADTRTRFGY